MSKKTKPISRQEAEQVVGGNEQQNVNHVCVECSYDDCQCTSCCTCSCSGHPHLG